MRGVHLMYVLRKIVLRCFSPTHSVATLPSHGEIPESYRYIQRFKETAEQHGLAYVILLFPRMQEKACISLSDRLTQDGIIHLDLSVLGGEFTKEQYMASRFDRHASAAVHRRIGESLVEYVQHLPGFAH
jgi:hypothetical protein